MQIEKEWSAPNGAPTAVHRVQMFIIDAAGITATVNSYSPSTLEAAAAEGKPPVITWQDRYQIPSSVLAEALEAIGLYLVSEGQALAGGVIVADPAPAA